MKVVFDLTPIYDHLTGVERYNINITREIIQSHPENDYVLIFKNEVHERFIEIAKAKNVNTVILKSCNKLFFIQIRLFYALRRIKADYFVFLSFTSPVLFRAKGIINNICDLTCWDCPESMPTKMKYYYRFTYKVAAKRSWRLITISKFSQNRICEKYHLKEANVPIIYCGLTDIFCKMQNRNIDIRTKYKLPEQYILSLSTIEPRKNLQLLIQAYKELMEEQYNIPMLVLAGRKGWKLDEILCGISENVKNRIFFTGFIEDDDLAQIYRESLLFVFPSKYEGFGLPVIEAMSQGTLVVSSDAASLPEVIGEAGIPFKSNDVEDLKRAIKQALEMPEDECNRRKLDGINSSHSFSWNLEAEKLYRIMEMGR